MCVRVYVLLSSGTVFKVDCHFKFVRLSPKKKTIFLKKNVEGLPKKLKKKRNRKIKLKLVMKI